MKESIIWCIILVFSAVLTLILGLIQYNQIQKQEKELIKQAIHIEKLEKENKEMLERLSKAVGIEEPSDGDETLKVFGV